MRHPRTARPAPSPEDVDLTASSPAPYPADAGMGTSAVISGPVDRPGFDLRSAALGRRSFVAAFAAAGASLALPRLARAEDVVVPVALQVKLLVKVAGYDKNLASRAGDRARVAVVTKSGDADAKRVAAQAISALGDYDSVAGLPLDAAEEAFTSAVELKKAITKRRLAIVYLTPGFDRAEIEAIAAALAGVDVLSVTAVPTDVPRGVVLGFDLISGKPKILVLLPQAKKQNVALSSDVVKLAKVFE